MPGAMERSAYACVSKRWLSLQSSIRRAELCSEKPAVKKLEVEVTFESAEDGEENTGDGYLTRCLEGKKATDTRLTAIAVGASGRGGLGKLIIRGSNSVRRVTNVGLSAVGRSCPSLRALSWWNLSSVGDGGIFEIGSGCPVLEKLDLCQCPLITDKGIAAIAENCPGLTSLSLESCPRIGNDSLQAIARYCPNLKLLNLQKCLNLSDEGLKAFTRFAISLESLHMEECHIITQAGVLAALTNCSLKLKELSLVKCFGIRETPSILPQFSLCKSLRSLTVRYCPGFGSAGLAMVGKLCPNLQNLDLEGICGATDAGLHLLLESCDSGLIKVRRLPVKVRRLPVKVRRVPVKVRRVPVKVRRLPVKVRRSPVQVRLDS